MRRGLDTPRQASSRSRYVIGPRGRARAGGGLEIARWHQVDLGAEDGLQVGLDPCQPEQAHVRWQVHEQVHVTVGPDRATSDAAEDPQVGYVRAAAAATRSRCFHLARQPAQLRRLLPDIHHEVE
jgi:hypothetical protein